MEDALRQYRQDLEDRNDECLRFREAHTMTSQMYAMRNSRLALIALISSALTGTSALWSAIDVTYFASGGVPLQLTSWGTALTGLISAVVTGAQKTDWASLEQAKKHHEAAAQYYQVAREAQRDLADTSANEKMLEKALRDVDAHIDGINSGEPFLPKKFLPKSEPASTQLNKLNAAGLVDIFASRASGSGADLLGERFQTKPRKVQILETWTGYGSQIGMWITQAVKDGAVVEILLLDPASEQVKYRAHALNTDVKLRRCP